MDFENRLKQNNILNTCETQWKDKGGRAAE